MDTIKNRLGKVGGKLAERKASFFSEHATAILITVVIGVIILTAMVLIFKGTIIPHLESLISDIFSTT
ncbi:MAG: hypothetical protein LBC58_06465 [Clostridiales Family XIII bacterium]|jgi:hypothetical protein|nr:hypothetical protein [Clostridiales Family XIII bacterium]